MPEDSNTDYAYSDRPSDDSLGWQTRSGFAMTVLLAAAMFYVLLFGAAIVLGLVATVIEIGFRLSAPMDLMVEITGAAMGIVAGALVALGGVSRLDDMGRSLMWLIPGAIAWLVFVISETDLFPAPDAIVSASILTVAATILALCLIPGRKKSEEPLADESLGAGRYLLVGDKLTRID